MELQNRKRPATDAAAADPSCIGGAAPPTTKKAKVWCPDSSGDDHTVFIDAQAYPPAFRYDRSVVYLTGRAPEELVRVVALPQDRPGPGLVPGLPLAVLRNHVLDSRHQTLVSTPYDSDSGKGLIEMDLTHIQEVPALSAVCLCGRRRWWWCSRSSRRAGKIIEVSQQQQKQKKQRKR
ncbi:hypothetical protein SPI_06842 [Niveomyces insectorum RCEF 264]|uniref:Uncharacterized protein n=1 Tax=Niveomyces insectorum RCEF 264 TaxID=1081102 RepID=A0A167QTT7_9HYPO|nr:hypothetical protein SPI_06842 [Niveomyces insectorum RCEF 264]